MKLDMDLLAFYCLIYIYIYSEAKVTQQVFCQVIFICNAQKLKFECVCKYSLLVNSCKWPCMASTFIKLVSPCLLKNFSVIQYGDVSAAVRWHNYTSNIYRKNLVEENICKLNNSLQFHQSLNHWLVKAVEINTFIALDWAIKLNICQSLSSPKFTFLR